jgi:hypothetical protein
MGTVTGTKTSTDHASPQLETVIGWTWRDRVGHGWRQLRAVVDEMNYAASRLVELQMRLPQ